VILVDSGVFIAALSTKDTHHAAAKEILQDIAGGVWGAGLVPEYAFVEVVNFLVRKGGLPPAIAFARKLLGSRDMAIVPCFPAFPAALSAFLNQHGSSLTFADAALVALARLGGVKHVATFDGEFRAVPGLRVVSGPERAS